MNINDAGDLLAKKKILVTGGTGSFGHQIVEELLKYDVGEIRIFSRGEDLQHQMARTYPDKRLRFILGDVRDYERVFEVMEGVDYVFHAAALKQVPDCETHPLEAVKTNIFGAYNVKRAAQLHDVKKVIAISTDKAVKPVNAMGMSKALQEKVILSDELGGKTKFSIVRYGNVIGSRGSVIPYFKQLVTQNKSLPITDFRMTRFWLALKDATMLVFKALCDEEDRNIYVLKRPACLIKDLAEVMADGKVDVVEVGIRPGEKIHETLVHEDEMRRTVEDEEHFMIYPYDSGTRTKRTSLREYTSENTPRMSRAEIKTMLHKEKWI